MHLGYGIGMSGKSVMLWIDRMIDSTAVDKDNPDV